MLPFVFEETAGFYGLCGNEMCFVKPPVLVLNRHVVKLFHGSLEGLFSLNQNRLLMERWNYVIFPYYNVTLFYLTTRIHCSLSFA